MSRAGGAAACDELHTAESTLPSGNALTMPPLRGIRSAILSAPATLDLEALCAGPSARRSEQPATGSSSANASSVRTREIYPPKGRESREKDRVQSGENGEGQGVWRVGPCSQQGEMDNGREGRGGVTLYTPCRCPLSLPFSTRLAVNTVPRFTLPAVSSSVRGSRSSIPWCCACRPG
jgi:hypothetical protein